MLVLVAIAITVGASCQKTAVELPDTPPSIAGTITSVDQQGEHRGVMRIEADPAQPEGSDKAVVTIDQKTALIDDAGKKIPFSQLKNGRKARAWFIGPVRESYPVQANASIVILEPADKP